MANITIIDDDVELANSLVTRLKKQGHTVHTLDTTAQGTDALLRAPPDLLIQDVMFPDNPCAGFDFVRQIRQAPALKRLPVILLTGVNQHFPMGFSETDIDPDWMPVQAFVEKPIDFKKLTEAIARLLRPAAP